MRHTAACELEFLIIKCRAYNQGVIQVTVLIQIPAQPIDSEEFSSSPIHRWNRAPRSNQQRTRFFALPKPKGPQAKQLSLPEEVSKSPPTTPKCLANTATHTHTVGGLSSHQLLPPEAYKACKSQSQIKGLWPKSLSGQCMKSEADENFTAFSENPKQPVFPGQTFPTDDWRRAIKSQLLPQKTHLKLKTR